MSSIKSLFGDAMNKKVVIIISGLIITSGILSTNNINFQNKCNKEVNIVTAVSSKDNYFIIPDSSTRYLTEDDLRGLSDEQLEIARNEIYARHGYIFVSDEWKDFFVNEDWYIPTSYSVKLNSIEEYNVAMIIKEEARR